MNPTKEKILSVSLELFSQQGFSAVSIRDICKQVAIKESSVYYHFQNKQAILDELLQRFQTKACTMMERLQQAMSQNQEPMGDGFYKIVCDHFFEDYLMEDFCNKVIRLMTIEQFNNPEIKQLYHRWMFEIPIQFQSSVFSFLVQMGVVKHTDSTYLAVSYYAPIYFYAQRWLFSGPLTDDAKAAFREATYTHIQQFFTQIGE